jgi:Zn-dependent peptidase ImmA (M78 family)/DNA-binding XRE family transcriptional regulator
MENVVAYRMRNARKLNGLSLQNVADELHVSKQMISKFETGASIPNSEKLIKLSKLFGLKIDYFFNSFKIELNEVNFRKKSTFSVKKQNSLKQKIKIRLENYLYIEEMLSINYKFDNPLKDFKIADNEDITKAVEKLKDKWKIGFEPVHNLIQLLEDNKIKIIELSDVEDNFDGLATFVDGKYPVIVLNKNFPVERKRFSLLHELGHVLLDISDSCTMKDEDVCHKFASEFLLPKNIVIEEFGGKRENITYSELISIQEKYGISIKAIVYRLKDAGILNENQHSGFYKKIRFNRKLEKVIDKSRFKTPEYSNRFERLVYRALAQENISISKASSLLNENIEVVKDNCELI